MLEQINEPVFIFEVNNELVINEQERLRPFFEHYLPKDFKPKNILDFACGIANEEPVLQDLYGSNIDITSFDNSPSMVETSKSLGRKSVIQSNTSDILEKITGAKIDLILGRNIPINPNRELYDEYPDPWIEFLEKIKTYMSSESYLLTTFVREDEYERAIELLNKNSYKIITSEKNIFTIPSDKIGIAGADVKDNFVIVSKI